MLASGLPAGCNDAADPRASATTTDGDGGAERVLPNRLPPPIPDGDERGHPLAQPQAAGDVIYVPLPNTGELLLLDVGVEGAEPAPDVRQRTLPNPAHHGLLKPIDADRVLTFDGRSDQACLHSTAVGGPGPQCVSIAPGPSAIALLSDTAGATPALAALYQPDHATSNAEITLISWASGVLHSQVFDLDATVLEVRSDLGGRRLVVRTDAGLVLLDDADPSATAAAWVEAQSPPRRRELPIPQGQADRLYGPLPTESGRSPSHCALFAHADGQSGHLIDLDTWSTSPWAGLPDADPSQAGDDDDAGISDQRLLSAVPLTPGHIAWLSTDGLHLARLGNDCEIERADTWATEASELLVCGDDLLLWAGGDLDASTHSTVIERVHFDRAAARLFPAAPIPLAQPVRSLACLEHPLWSAPLLLIAHADEAMPMGYTVQGLADDGAISRTVAGLSAEGAVLTGAGLFLPFSFATRAAFGLDRVPYDRSEIQRAPLSAPPEGAGEVSGGRAVFVAERAPGGRITVFSPTLMGRRLSGYDLGGTVERTP